MTMCSISDTILYHIGKRSEIIPVLDAFANAKGYKVYRADDFADVFAMPYKAAILEKELIEDWFYEHLRNTYLDHTHDDALKEIDPNFDFNFNETLILLGDASDVPPDVQHFFHYYPNLTLETLKDLIPPNTSDATIYNNKLDLNMD